MDDSGGTGMERRSSTGSAESSGSGSSSSSRESLAALVCGTLISLTSIFVLAWAWLVTDRFQGAPWWAGPVSVAIAALPTSVRASVVRGIAGRVLPRPADREK